MMASYTCHREGGPEFWIRPIHAMTIEVPLCTVLSIGIKFYNSGNASSQSTVQPSGVGLIPCFLYK